MERRRVPQEGGRETRGCEGRGRCMDRPRRHEEEKFEIAPGISAYMRCIYGGRGGSVRRLLGGWEDESGVAAMCGGLWGTRRG